MSNTDSNAELMKQTKRLQTVLLRKLDNKIVQDDFMPDAVKRFQQNVEKLKPLLDDTTKGAISQLKLDTPEDMLRSLNSTKQYKLKPIFNFFIEGVVIPDEKERPVKALVMKFLNKQISPEELKTQIPEAIGKENDKSTKEKVSSYVDKLTAFVSALDGFEKLTAHLSYVKDAPAQGDWSIYRDSITFETLRNPNDKRSKAAVWQNLPKESVSRKALLEQYNYEKFVEEKEQFSASGQADSQKISLLEKKIAYLKHQKADTFGKFNRSKMAGLVIEDMFDLLKNSLMREAHLYYLPESYAKKKAGALAALAQLTGYDDVAALVDKMSQDISTEPQQQKPLTVLKQVQFKMPERRVQEVKELLDDESQAINKAKIRMYQHRTQSMGLAPISDAWPLLQLNSDQESNMVVFHVDEQYVKDFSIGLMAEVKDLADLSKVQDESIFDALGTLFQGKEAIISGNVKTRITAKVEEIRKAINAHDITTAREKIDELKPLMDVGIDTPLLAQKKPQLPQIGDRLDSDETFEAFEANLDDGDGDTIQDLEAESNAKNDFKRQGGGLVLRLSQRVDTIAQQTFVSLMLPAYKEADVRVKAFDMALHGLLGVTDDVLAREMRNEGHRGVGGELSEDFVARFSGRFRSAVGAFAKALEEFDTGEIKTLLHQEIDYGLKGSKTVEALLKEDVLEAVRGKGEDGAQVSGLLQILDNELTDQERIKHDVRELEQVLSDKGVTMQSAANISSQVPSSTRQSTKSGPSL